MISFFIPIRSGSKRVKNKNLRKLPGFKFGLTEIKIKQLEKFRKYIKYKKTNLRFEYVVSTNCKKTQAFLSKYDWIKLHKRSKKLSTDDSLDKLIGIVPNICAGKIILWTHVTSPFFDHKDYYDIIKTCKTKKFSSAFSADKIQKFIFSLSKKWISHDSSKKKWPRTQDLEPFYIANSAAFLTKRNIYIKEKNKVCNNPLPVLTKEHKSFDIDNEEDFQSLITKIKSGKKII